MEINYKEGTYSVLLIILSYVPVLMVSMPVPLQWVQLIAFVPGSALDPLHLGQVSTTFTLMSLFTPRAAWANVRFIITCKQGEKKI
jgi:hypothetical protein